MNLGKSYLLCFDAQLNVLLFSFASYILMAYPPLGRNRGKSVFALFLSPPHKPLKAILLNVKLHTPNFL